MTANKVVKLIWAAAMLAGSMGGCECQRDVAAVDDSAIGVEPITKQEPNAPRPDTHFPRNLQTDDPAFNKFIDHTLSVCEAGDYEGFRQLFGTTYSPTGQADFFRVWHGVQDIQVKAIYPGRPDPKEYFVHAVVRLREPDRRGREKRDAVLWAFLEAGEWRLGPAPKEIVGKVIAASSRPAERATAKERSP